MHHDDLLRVAEHLVQASPEEAFARKAISTAYYALFHLLIAGASHRFMPAAPEALRTQATRAFSHTEMKAVCRRFASPQPSATEAWAHLLSLPIETELQRLAETFIVLQEIRHLADYDLSAQFPPSYAAPIVARVRQAFGDWAAVRSSPNANVFLAALLLNRAWSRPG